MPKDQRGFGIALLIIALLIIAIVGAGAYYLGTKNLFNAKPSSIVAPISTPEASPTLIPSPPATSSASPSASASATPSAKDLLLENIKASVTSKNYAALEGNMETQVNMVIEATECCGIVTAVKATQELSYLNTATAPWNFNQNDPVVSGIKQKFPALFPQDSLIGIAANNFMVAFTLNASKDKIEKIYMAASYKLLDNK